MFAVTERLLLRPGWAEDAPALARALGDERVARTLSRVPWPYAADDARAFLALPRTPARPNFVVARRDDGRLIGGISVSDGPRGEPELGYWLARDQWGRGYATEAGRAVLDLADHSLRLPRLAASYMMDNPGSGRVLAKLGFRPAGAARQRSLARDGEVDVLLMTRDRAVAADDAEPLAA